MNAKKMQLNVKVFHHFRTWIIVVACLILVIICTPTLIHILNPSGIDDPRSGSRYEFSSYSELCSVLPEGSIIANIPNSKEANINAYVECPDGTTNFTDYNKFSYLNVDISYDDSTGVSIFCIVKSEKTAKEDIGRKSTLFLSKKVNMVTISDYDIYYISYEDASHENGIVEINIAEVSIDGSLYKFSTTTFSQKELIQYIIDMLNCR